MRTALILAWALVELLAPAAPAAADENHPFTVDDLLAMERISDPQVSPDGRRVAFVLRTTDLAANQGRTDLWLVGADGQGLRRLTRHEAADSEPRWAPDGAALYFVSGRSGSSQVWRLPVDGGEPEQVTDLPLPVANLALAPDGSRLAFTIEVFQDCDRLQCTVDRLAEREEDPASGVLHDRLFVRHWDTWKDGRRSHLFTWAVAGGEPVDVTAGLDADIPSKPFGGSEEFTFTPDGSGLVYTARVAAGTEPWSTDFDLYLVPADGSAPAAVLTGGNAAWDTQPVFSPDGKTLAYLAMERPGFEADRFRIVLRGWPEGTARVLTGEWDRSPHEIAFSSDGATIYATSGDTGQVRLFAVAVATGEVRRLVEEGHVRWPQAAAGGKVVFGREHLRSPVELFAVDATGGAPAPVTRINAERLATAAMGEPEHFSFTGAAGDTVWAWLVKPVGLEPGRRYPLVFLIHGGPQGSFGDDFHYRWNPQVYAGAGYAALMIDFHGSTGYGQSFTDAIRLDWGGKPLEDLRRGLAAALERYPWIDGERTCALGASYGGYMVNWIAGAWPDRFRCLVNHDGIFDLRMMYFSTEELWFPEWEFGGPWWESPEAYERHNPVRLVASWRTPMLVIHGGRDFRVPETQGLATFTALQRRGIPSRFLYFPDENHWVLQPANSIQWHETVLGWLERWLGEAEKE